MKIVLASTSPSRKLILENSGIKNYELHAPENINEKEISENVQSIEEKVLLLSEKKAESVANKYTGENVVIIGVDSMVLNNNKILGKPKNEEEQIENLKNYSNNLCELHSGHTFIKLPEYKKISVNDVSKIYFSEIGKQDIEEYIKSGKWQGVAGGIKIESIGSKFVKKINGNYNNIIGLNINLVYNFIKKVTK